MQNPTPSELEILAILWEEKEASTATVNNKLKQTRDVRYTGTLKLMQLMHQKKLLGRRREGRSHIYYPLIAAAETQSTLLDRFIDTTFGGSTSRLMMQLLGNKKVSNDELEKTRSYLDQVEG